MTRSVTVVTLAKLNLPDCARASAMNSFSELTPSDAGTASVTTVFVTRATGSMSFLS